MTTITSQDIKSYLISKYQKLLRRHPDVAMSYYRNQDDVPLIGTHEAPQWYIMQGTGLVVNAIGIHQWVDSHWPLPQHLIDLLMDKPMSLNQLQQMVELQTEVSTGSRRCVGEKLALPPTHLSSSDPYTISINSWRDFVSTFMQQGVWAHPLVIYAHYLVHQGHTTLSMIPSHVAHSIVDGISSVMPNKHSIAVVNETDSDGSMFEHYSKYGKSYSQNSYPLNRLLLNWVRSTDGSNHKLLSEVCTLLWMYYISTPSTWGPYIQSQTKEGREIVLAQRALYTGYSAFSQELLRVYPQLILTIADLDTLDQIQMEHELFHHDLIDSWQWLLTATSDNISSRVASYQEKFPVAYSPVDQLLVSPKDLEDARVDIRHLVDGGTVELLINTANTPLVSPNALDKLQKYSILGKVYGSSLPYRLITHEDQLKFQAVDRKSIVQPHPKDHEYFYPNAEDVYSVYRVKSRQGVEIPVTESILRLGERSMNPNQHFQGMTPQQGMFQPQAMQQSWNNTPMTEQQAFAEARMGVGDACHGRYLYITGSILDRQVNQVYPAHPQMDMQYRLKERQRASAASGVYYAMQVGGSVIDVLFQDTCQLPNGQVAAVVAIVDPNLNGLPNLSQFMLNSPMIGVPVWLLPGIPMNTTRRYILQMGGTPADDTPRSNPFIAAAASPQMGGLTSSAFLTTNPMQNIGSSGKPKDWIVVQTREQLESSAYGTVCDDADGAWIRTENGVSFMSPVRGDRPERFAARYLDRSETTKVSKQPAMMQRPVTPEPVKVTEMVTTHTAVQDKPSVVDSNRPRTPYKSFIEYTTEEARGYILEKEYARANGTNPNPIVGFDNDTQADVTLGDVMSNSKYLEATGKFSWYSNKSTYDRQRWKTQYEASRWMYWAMRDEARRKQELEVATAGVEISPVARTLLEANDAQKARDAVIRNGDNNAKSVDDLMMEKMGFNVPDSIFDTDDAVSEEVVNSTKLTLNVPPTVKADAPLSIDFGIRDSSDRGEDISSQVEITSTAEGDFEIIVHDVYKDHSGPFAMTTPAVSRSKRLTLARAVSTGEKIFLVLDRTYEDNHIAGTFPEGLNVSVDDTIAHMRAARNPEVIKLRNSPIPGAPSFKVERHLTDLSGEVVDRQDLLDRLDDETDTTAEFDIQEEGLDVHYDYSVKVSDSQDEITLVTSSIEHAVSILESSDLASGVNSDGTSYISGIYAGTFDNYKVVGDSNMAGMVDWINSEISKGKIDTDASSFLKWLMEYGQASVAKQRKSDVSLPMSGVLDKSMARGAENYKRFSRFVTLLTQRINKVLRTQYGYDLQITNYAEQGVWLRKQMKSEKYNVSGQSASWIKTETAIIEQFLKDLKTDTVACSENEEFVNVLTGDNSSVVYTRKSIVIDLAARYEDLDLQLSTVARSIPDDCNEVTAELVSSLQTLIDPITEDYMSAPTEMVDIYVHLCDGVIIELHLHPTMVLNSNGRHLWMASLVTTI